MAAAAAEHAAQPRHGPARLVEVELQTAHEAFGVAHLQILVGRGAQVRHGQPQDAAGLQHAPALGQKRSRLRTIEMLQHVRGIDRIDGSGALRDAPRGIDVPDAMAAAEGDEGQAVPVDQPEPCCQRRQDRPTRQPDRR